MKNAYFKEQLPKEVSSLLLSSFVFAKIVKLCFKNKNKFKKKKKEKGLTHTLNSIGIIKAKKSILGAFGQHFESKLGLKTDKKYKRHLPKFPAAMRWNQVDN